MARWSIIINAPNSSKLPILYLKHAISSLTGAVKYSSKLPILYLKLGGLPDITEIFKLF